MINDNSSNVIQIEKAESSYKLDFCRVDRTIDEAKERYCDKPNLDNKGLQKSIKVQESEFGSKTLILHKSKPDVDSEQNQYQMIENSTINQNSENTSYRRWGRNEDIQMFNTLREL